MSKTNCINCGSAKDISEIKCPFCGTTYLDFTAIDFTSHAPVVCQFVLPYTDRRTIMSMVARPEMRSITLESPMLEITSLNDCSRNYLPGPPQMNVEISFIPVEHKGIMFKLRQEEKSND